MTRTKATTQILILLAFTLCATASAFAQSSRVYITANRGTDLNTCTRTSPCRNIERALEVVETGGEIVLLSNRKYHSPTIDKTLNVTIARGVKHTVIVTDDGSEEAVTVKTESATNEVALRAPMPSTQTTSAQTAGTVLISEFRPNGPNGTADEYVELYKKLPAQVALNGWT